MLPVKTRIVNKQQTIGNKVNVTSCKLQVTGKTGNLQPLIVSRAKETLDLET
jgi:hypothetical protein